MRSMKEYEPKTQPGTPRPSPSVEGNDFRMEALKIAVVGGVLTFFLIWIG
jgi:hypothetical protein